MPTVRLRKASEYPESAQKLFELSKAWFNFDFAEPPAMSRVMAWDPHFGGAARPRDEARDGAGRVHARARRRWSPPSSAA